MGDVRLSQAHVYSVADGSGDVRLSQLHVFSVYNMPSESVELSQLGVNAVASGTGPVQLSQLHVFAVVRARAADLVVRAWTFTLDGHDFYVLRLGDAETLVYDTHSEQWAVWGSSESERWRTSLGQNWLGATSFAGSYGSNVVVGDDTLGVLWFLDPERDFDEDADDGPDTPVYFRRYVTGQIVVRGVTAVPCFEAFLTANLGDPNLLSPDVTLYTSDDQGETYDSHGAITITVADRSQRLSWTSLGQAEAPGRLFRIEDSGAIARIDALDLNP